MDSVLFRSIFLRLLKFLQTKEGGLNFWGELILKKGWIIWASLLYFNFKTLKDPDSSSFIRFQWVLYNSEELLSDFWNFYKLNRGDQISGGWPTLQKVWIICPPPPPPPFCISVLKLSKTQILFHLLDFNGFCMIQKSFYQTSEISTN